MAQSSISNYFIARKRGIEDDVIASKKKVICLERTRNSSESQDCHTDSDELGAKVVFPKAHDNLSSHDDEAKTVVRKPTIRQGITPQRTTRSRKIHMQDVDGIETPKMMNFWKGGNLSPQKKSKGFLSEHPVQTVTSQPPETKDDVLEVPGPSTPTKQRRGSIEKTPLMSSNAMPADAIKKKLKGSTRLTELKTTLNKLQGGLDRLDQMEKKRLTSAPLKGKREVAAEAPKALKPFKSIELEILR